MKHPGRTSEVIFPVTLSIPGGIIFSFPLRLLIEILFVICIEMIETVPRYVSIKVSIIVVMKISYYDES